MSTILFVALKGFYARQHVDLEPPVVVHDRGVVLDISGGVGRVRAGMPLRAARLLTNGRGTWVPYREERYLVERDRWLSVLLDYSDTIEPIAPAQAYVDLRGHSDVREVASEILRSVWRETGLSVAGGLASSRWLARLSARRCDADALRLGLSPIEPLHDPGDWLARQSVWRLVPVDIETRLRLERLGARTIGEVLALGASALSRQFGRDGERIILAAAGRLSDPVAPRWPPRSHLHQLNLVSCEDDIRLSAAFRELAARGVARLAQEESQPTKVILRLVPDTGPTLVAERTPKQPLTGATALATMLGQMRKELRVDGPLRRALLVLSGLTAARFRQETLDSRVASGGDLPESVLRRLRAAYGEQALLLAREAPTERVDKVLRAWQAVYGRA